MSLRNRLKQTQQAGFTLMELLVTIFIITIVTAVVLWQYSSFNSKVLLKSQAFELALDIREAQTAGVSVRSGEGGTEYAFGININLNDNHQYILFEDTNENAQRANSSNEDVGVPFLLDPRYQIDRICSSSKTNCPHNRLDVTFRRPNFDAVKILDGSGSVTSDTVYIGITPVNGTGDIRWVTIYSVGQIAVE